MCKESQVEMTDHNNQDTPTISDTETSAQIDNAHTQEIVEYAEDSPSRTGCVFGLGSVLVVFCVIPTIAITFLISAGFTSIDELFQRITNLVNPQTQATIYDSPTLVNSVRPLGQLVAVSAQLAKADIQIDITSGALNSCGVGAKHVAQGTIEAGLDLNGIDETNITYDAELDIYFLSLPAPTITSCRIDYIRQYDRSTTVCNTDWDEVRLLANYTATEGFATDAIEGGILERARDETDILLHNFIESLTGSGAEIQFEESTSVVLPPSSIPQLPNGWVIDEATGVWSKP